MKRIAFLIVCLVLLLISMSAAQSEKSDIVIVVPDRNLWPNPDIKTGDTMFGLYNTKVGFVVLPSKIVVEAGADDQCRKFMKIRAEEAAQPLFLVGGLPLKSGKVKTVFLGNQYLNPGGKFPWTVEEQEQGSPIPPENRYVLRAFGCAVDRFKKSLIYDYSVKLFRGDQSQTLDYYKVADTSRPSRYGVLDVTDHQMTSGPREDMRLPVLIWAGDIDNDGKPDLFMWWPCPGKDAGVYSLFVSSAAKNNDLVAKIPVIAYTQPAASR